MSEPDDKLRSLIGGELAELRRLRALLSDAPIIEIFHHGQKRAFAHGESERDLLNEMAMIVDPIGVARRVAPGTYKLVAVPVEEETDDGDI